MTPVVPFQSLGSQSLYFGMKCILFADQAAVDFVEAFGVLGNRYTKRSQGIGIYN